MGPHVPGGHGAGGGAGATSAGAPATTSASSSVGVGLVNHGVGLDGVGREEVDLVGRIVLNRGRVRGIRVWGVSHDDVLF